MSEAIERLRTIMLRLRDPERGCPWDREQTFASIAPYTIEEAYEVADAIERNELTELKGELGDLLFQVIFHSQMASEQGLFNLDEVANAICEKLERRHPHVFGDAEASSTSELNKAELNKAELNKAWEEHKRQERAARNAEANVVTSVLDDVPMGLPALTRATKLGKRASGVGFDWPNIDGAFDKVFEELQELRVAVKSKVPDDIHAELGDLLFSLANVGRHLKVDLESALRSTNAKFERRFRYVEQRLSQQGKTPQQSSLEEMDALWDEAKIKEAEAKNIVSQR